MRRAFRHFRIAATILSLLLCVATAVLTVRSFFAADWFEYDGALTIPGDEFGGYECAVRSEMGGVEVEIVTVTVGEPVPADARWKHSIAYARQEPHLALKRAWMGFYWHRSDRKMALDDWLRKKWIVFPLYAPLLIFGVPPGLWLRNALKRRRHSRQGLCPTCGYDLRASPGRCPECGLAANAHATASNPGSLFPKEPL